VFHYRDRRWKAPPKCWRFMCERAARFPSVHATLSQRPFWKAKLDRFVDATPQPRYERLMRARSLKNEPTTSIYWTILFAYQSRGPATFGMGTPGPAKSIPSLVRVRVRYKPRQADAERLVA
jgi:hypothetical protein